MWVIITPLFSEDTVKAELVLVACVRCAARFVVERNVNPGFTVHDVPSEGSAPGGTHMGGLDGRTRAEQGSPFPGCLRDDFREPLEEGRLHPPSGICLG